MNRITGQRRQGDVLLQPISAIPSTAKRSTDRVLALGETSGHGHIVDEAIQVYRDGDTIHLSVEEEAALRHLLVQSGVWTGEHHTIQTIPGTYRVIAQQEYNPYEQAMEAVAD